MQNLLNIKRDLRDVKEIQERTKEYNIKQIQAQYGYDRENAEKLYELLQVKRVEVMWGTAIGAAAAYKTFPMVRELQHSFRLFRKPWMRYPF